MTETGATVSDFLRLGPRGQEPLIIDFHTHLGRWFHYWFPEESADQLVARMDVFGIKTSVAHHTLGLAGEFRRGNDIVGQAMRDYPGRIEGAAVVNPNYVPDIAPELLRCLERYDMRIIKLHPSTHRYPLDGPHYWPAYEFAARHGFMVVTHCGPMAEFGSAAQLGAMASKFPEVSFVAYHVAGDWKSAEIYGEAMRERPNYFVEICSDMTENVIEKVVQEAGEDRVLFGSDHIFLALQPTLGRVFSCRLSEQQKRKLLGLNAKRLLDRLRP